MIRRDFVKAVAVSGLMLNINGFSPYLKNSKKLNILVLGGTNFVGPSVVKAGVRVGHRITLFNRGITNPNLFLDQELIIGDRELGNSSYEPLKKEVWDVVIDVWPEKSKLVDDASKALQNHCKHYIFISSIAVYNNFQEVGLNEDSDTVSLVLPKEEWAYPEEKLAAENFVIDRFKENHTIIRAGAIKGTRDPAFDLLYWVLKLSRNENIIAPGSGKDPIQFIDTKDVGRFCILAAEQKLNGVYNCIGPKKILKWKKFLGTAKRHLGSRSNLIWMDEAFLGANEVYSFSDLPLWAPLSEDRGFMQISNQKMLETGFILTPIRYTIDDCIEWYRSNLDQNLKFGTEEVEVGLERARELELIRIYKS